MNEYRIRRAKPIAAEMRVPGDFAITQRALVVAALANGPSVLTGLLRARECAETVAALRVLGVKFAWRAGGDDDFVREPAGTAVVEIPQGATGVRVWGTGGKFGVPAGTVNCGGSREAMMLLAGALAGLPFVTCLSGNDSVSVQGVAAALREMGAEIKTDEAAVVEVVGNAQLKGALAALPVSGALARDALLLAGLSAQRKTAIVDEAAAPDHLERLLRHYQVKTRREGLKVSVWGGQVAESRDVAIPGDISYAAPFLAAAAAQPGSILTVRGVGLNASRTGFLRVLVRMGAQVMEEISAVGGEPYGTVIVRGAPLRGTVIEAAEAAGLEDELPVLMVAAAVAAGGTVIRQTPRTVERMARMAHDLRLMGVEVAPLKEGIEIKGGSGKPLQPGLTSPHGDPHLTMACAMAGLFTDGETIVEGVECVESRWQGFGEDLRRFQSREISEAHFTPMLHAVPKVAGKVRAVKTKPEEKEKK